MWLRFLVAVAVIVPQAGSCSSDPTPSLGTSTCCGCGPKGKKLSHQSCSISLEVAPTLSALHKTGGESPPCPPLLAVLGGDPDAYKSQWPQSSTFLAHVVSECVAAVAS